MELIHRAIALCAEIEEKQSELRALLQKICNEAVVVDQIATAEPVVDEPCVDVSDAEVAKASDCEPLEKTINSTLAKHRSDIRKAFTINDRFRFRRELFAGDDSALSAVIDRLATFETLAEADSYLSTMPWDSDSEAMSEFMTIVSNHFNGYR